MNTPNDGGPAFPKLKGLQQQVRANGPDYLKAEVEGGMSLRDYFAGQALPAVIGNLNTEQGLAGIKELSLEEGIAPNMVIAKMAYEYADAMLAARDGKEGA